MIKVTLSKDGKPVYTPKYKNFHEANQAAFAYQRLAVLETIKVPVDKDCVKEGQFTFKRISNPYYGMTAEVTTKINQTFKKR